MISINPPLICLHSYLVSKERFILVATFQDCFDFENENEIKKLIHITILVYHSIAYMSR